MSYKHFNTFERGKIEVLYKLGYSIRAIAKEIDRHHSSVAREIKRNSIVNTAYSAKDAQSKYRARKTKSFYKGKFNKEIKKYIVEKLLKTWSPEQIANYTSGYSISFKTIYRWIYSKKIKVSLKLLRHKGKRQKPFESRGRFEVGTPISKRPTDVKSRLTFGHWELDTIVSNRGKSKGCLANFVERKTRLYTGYKIPDRTAKSMEFAIKKLYSVLLKGSFIRATADRGKEFACYKNIESDLGVKIYFADPYFSWQRGSNENSTQKERI